MMSFLQDKLRDHLLKYYLRRSIARPKKTNHISTTQPLPVGLIYTAEVGTPEKNKAVLHIIEKMKASDKTVHVLCYLPGQQMPPDRTFRAFTKQDISLLGEPTNQGLQKFLKTHFSHVYHLDLNSDAALDYVIECCHAQCKIGHFIPHLNREPIFDVIFKGLSESDHKFTFYNLFEKLFNYTQLLKI